RPGAPVAIVGPFCCFCRCLRRTKGSTNVKDNLVGNDAKRDNIVCPENGAIRRAPVGSRALRFTRMSEGRPSNRPVHTKMYVFDIRHTFSKPRLCPAGVPANSRPVAVAASTEARTDLRSLSVLS